MRAVVFVLRGCPAGWLGAYGNEWVGTPNLDRLAAESVVFDRHISDRPDAAAASAAWLGGEPDAPVLTALRAAGVRTVLVRANHPDTDGPDWFYAGWGEVFDARPQEEDSSPLDALIRELPALLDGLAASEHLLLWVEIDRLLPPWDVRQDVFEAYLEDEEETEPTATEVEDEADEEPAADDAEEPGTQHSALGAEESAQGAEPTEAVPPWFDPPTGTFDVSDADAWEWLHSTFAAVVTSLDAELGVLFDQLRARGLDRTAAWLVTSDFGYPLGEHGQVGLYRPWLYEELVHLPLILRLPDAAEACRRVAGFTQPPDVATTLLNVFSLAPGGLLPPARGEGESSRRFVVTELEHNGAAERALRTDGWAYLSPVKVPEGESREPQLYEMPDDRWEVNDLCPRNIERADELEALLRALLSPPRTQSTQSQDEGGGGG